MEPLLSVVTITYNHEPYIAKCIEGVLMQKVNFPIEFIIAEDCSTDGTRTICEEYAAKYPELITLITSDHNIGYNPNELRAMKAARGKYIAYCEGDDYWTCPDKLQRQVGFMEGHPDYSVCFHRCEHYDIESNIFRNDKCGDLFRSGADGCDVTIDMFFHNWITQPLTMVFRVSNFDMSLYGAYRYYRDMHQIYHLLKEGRGYIFSFVGGVRTMHSGGIASMIPESEKCVNAVEIAKELFKRNKDIPTREYYAEVLQWYLYNIGSIKKGRLVQSVTLFVLTKDVKKLVNNLLR